MGCPLVSSEFVPILSSITGFEILKNPDQIPFLLINIKFDSAKGDNMAKSHYSIKKRKKELARKLKQEQKRQRRLAKNSQEPEEASDKPEDEVMNLLKE